jgi:hypothetical protein
MGFLSRMLGVKRRRPHWVHPEDAGLVLDEDREWFSGLSDADVAALNQEDNVFRYAAFLKAKDEGLSAEDAARGCWKYFPYYYSDPSERGRNPLGFSGANAELPFLIKNRVTRLAIAGSITKDIAESHETMNAAIRQLLQGGA